MDFLKKSLWITITPVLVFGLVALLAVSGFSQSRGGAAAQS